MALGMAIFSIASGVMQYKAAQDAADDQEEIARENARLIAEETEESARREEKAAAAAESQSRARAAASGVTLSGSTSEYLSEQQKANADRIKWLRKSGKSRASITEREGAMTAGATRARGTANLVGSVGSAYGHGYNYGQTQGWWK